MTFKNVTVREAHAQQTDGATYVDVRSIPEFQQSHPAGAVNVPLLHFDEGTGQMHPNHEFLDVMRAIYPSGAKLLIGCKVGGRSAQAAQFLTMAGFDDVTNVLGGFAGTHDPITGAVRDEGWVDAGLPVESGTADGRNYQDLQAKAAKAR